MKPVIIFHSYSGTTRSVAEQVAAACSGTMTEVRSTQYSSRLTAYTVGCYRAMKGESDPIEPATIDAATASVIVIGTPVWAGRATPAINGAVAALDGCAGKKAVIFATCGKNTGETFPRLRQALEARGVTVAGEFGFDRTGVKDPARIEDLIRAVQAAGETG